MKTIMEMVSQAGGFLILLSVFALAYVFSLLLTLRGDREIYKAMMLSLMKKVDKVEETISDLRLEILQDRRSK